MKYNFVYDTDFLEKNRFYLSKEEVEVVFATVVGKHNAIFYGYKPERLVEAIKKLTSFNPFVETSEASSVGKKYEESQGGILHIKDFDSWSLIDQQYIYSFTLNDKDRLSQSIVTTINNPLETVVPDVINNFDIIYMCKDNHKYPYQKGRLSNKYKRVYDYHSSLLSGCFVTSTELKVDGYWLKRDAYSYLCKLTDTDPVIARKVSVVSRSVSDCRHNNLTTMDGVCTAENLCGVHIKANASPSSEELW